MESREGKPTKIQPFPLIKCFEDTCWYQHLLCQCHQRSEHRCWHHWCHIQVTIPAPLVLIFPWSRDVSSRSIPWASPEHPSPLHSPCTAAALRPSSSTGDKSIAMNEFPPSAHPGLQFLCLRVWSLSTQGAGQPPDILSHTRRTVKGFGIAHPAPDFGCLMEEVGTVMSFSHKSLACWNESYVDG